MSEEEKLTTQPSRLDFMALIKLSVSVVVHQLLEPPLHQLLFPPHQELALAAAACLC
jgi:hypothetical protein